LFLRKRVVLPGMPLHTFFELSGRAESFANALKSVANWKFGTLSTERLVAWF